MRPILAAAAVFTILMFGAAFLVTGGSSATTPVHALPRSGEPATPTPDPSIAEPSTAPSASLAPAAPPGATPVAPAADDPPPLDPEERLRALAPLAQDVSRGLVELEDRVAHCALDRATLLVTLESLQGAVRIAEARVSVLTDPSHPPAGDSEPGSDARAERCVRDALEGVGFDAPSAKPGRRWEMPWSPGTAP
jgi:hypothetical protein